MPPTLPDSLSAVSNPGTVRHGGDAPKPPRERPEGDKTGVPSHGTQGREHLRATREHPGLGDAGVEVRLGDGRGVRVHQDYAWFIVVEPRAHVAITQE